ncbi:putative integrase, catalytic region [Paraburkholderia xenovorans LB400]|nr:putative integrase, catalytic region [Paraburkholderia xenovorans LB400]
MSRNGTRACHKRRYRVTTDSSHKLPVALNLLTRKGAPAAPNQARSVDLRYVGIDESRRHRAVVLDSVNPEVVGWSIKSRVTADLATDALTAAWCYRKPARAALRYSDCGSQCASRGFRRKLRRIAHALFDEPQGKWPEQRADGELPQQPEARADAWHEVSHASGGHSGLV